MTLDLYEHLMGGFALVFGLCIGSFLNVCIARMPENRSVVSPPSACPACGHSIRPWDNIPVLSWVLLRARCRDCGNPISSLYPTIEILVGLLSWLLWRQAVPDLGHLTTANVAGWGLHLSFAAMLVAQAYIDIRHYIVPDEFSIYAAPFGILGSAAVHALGYAHAPSWQQSVVGALLGGATLGAVAAAYWLIRREEGMGLGDVKLLTMIGAFVGAVPALPIVLMIASITGAGVGLAVLVARGRGLRSAVPFGPFLALGALVYLLHGETIVARFFPGLGAALEALQ